MSVHVQSLDEFFSMLVEEQRDIRITLAGLEDAGQPVALDQTTQGRVSRIDAISQQHMAKAGSSRLMIQLDRIKAALDRYESGRYGICCRCELEIGHGRLMADPAAPFCLECTEELAEAKQHNMRRNAGR
ncbi:MULTISPECIES: TraR/DksA C4-type zinc finger protein [Stenotrophomonas]|mgnify:CR=1 FL=1|jgi:DnaK suppressor protein|uniref:Molecular chaperone DnaK n=2 Tax=Stenotrophomonas TaxID=40323 RepID=A0A2J0SV45_STEMA|nr:MULTISPECIES: TraR/DksA C4-type zinc finger protein [Stenotrophomonas]AVO30423.1 molecular chaperone DnaK [Stenotrophomonas maltophilia]EKT4443437.1 molecular chaperone DnaK [Stenotrophomonas maltophilia]ELF4102106.1 molecular chaperone DnaK [Stenotrophomonas maltophilia]MBA0240281.1 molecular chaperone DnaK [Stenotrophomonas maltophilia]MBA0288174.1 molecular chaperone DnaK [Stenotrophomonas maltophilia]